MNFNDMSIKALRAYAKENGIKLQSATKKSDIVAILEEATADTAVAENNVVASKAEEARAHKDLLEREVPDNAPKAKEDGGTILYSERRYSSSKLGKLDLGYNIVKDNLARYWVRLPDVRIAEPDELKRATEAGIKPGELIGPKGRRM